MHPSSFLQNDAMYSGGYTSDGLASEWCAWWGVWCEWCERGAGEVWYAASAYAGATSVLMGGGCGGRIAW